MELLPATAVANVSILSGVVATALSGSPADPSQPSANPGQAVLVTGTNITTLTPITMTYSGSDGAMHSSSVTPTVAAADGSSATLIVPDWMNGVTVLTTAPTPQFPLQIVPTLKSWSIDGTDGLRLHGTGLQEGSTPNPVTYSFAGGTVSDTNATSDPDVYTEIPGSDNNAVYLAAEPAHGFGSVTTQTAGGTSAPMALNELQPQVGLIRGIAMNLANPTQLWVGDNANPAALHLIDTTTGQPIRSIAITKVSNATSAIGNTTFFGGLQVVPTAFILRSAPVPAGSLLVFYAPANPDYVVALNPATGNVIANLPLSANYDTTSGVYDPGIDRIFLIDRNHAGGDRIVSVFAATGGGHSAGAEDAAYTFPAPLNSGDSGLALDPSGNGTLWFGSDQSGSIVQITETGVVRGWFTIETQALENIGLSGLVFDGSNNLLAGSNQGAVLKLQLNPARLDIAKNGTQERLFWSTSLAGFVLESNSNLSVTTGWTTVAGTVGVSGDIFFRDLDPNDSQVFFRLRLQ